MSVANEEECHIMATEIFGIINLGYNATVVEVKYGYLPSDVHRALQLLKWNMNIYIATCTWALQLLKWNMDIYLATCTGLYKYI